eukprot:CAMPEP_0175065562 /NCGR_PEP_ID=MMETSP0052_2-20121109/15999_1 /TAXON_ID=51329 ORGANISM="Polytomella parva, Strain SAG 63-3" /NCGR_SAMPLE_ID=MMETSP0052_2 /ASSEMBLY_ACC=CAM_ASM_000194 /LENGTH=400 /DNA_ID=CAMNT_0016332121 /DNA_START=181 /DNA_END=1383 /DNA_ORIENTATION=+
MAYSKAADKCAEQILETFKLFSGAPFEGAIIATREDLKAISQKIRGDSGKIGVLFSNYPSSAPTADEAAGVLREFTCGIISVLTCLYHFGYNGGNTLLQSLKSQAEKITEASVELCESVKKSSKAPETVKRAVGRTWSICDNFAKTPLDNKSALFAVAANFLVTSKDILRELDELATDNAAQVKTAIEALTTLSLGASTGEASAQINSDTKEGEERQNVRQGNDEDDDDDLEYQLETDELSMAETATLKASRALLELGTTVVKTVSRQLLGVKDPITLPDIAGQPSANESPIRFDEQETREGRKEGKASVLEAWETIMQQCRRLKSAAEDLGGALYPPHDNKEVKTAADKFYEHLDLLLTAVPAPSIVATAVEAANWTEDFKGKLLVAKSSLDAAIESVQ